MYQVRCRSEQYFSTLTPKSMLKMWPGFRTLPVGAEWAPISCGPLKTAGQLLTSQAAVSPIFSRRAVIQAASSCSLMPGLAVRPTLP